VFLQVKHEREVLETERYINPLTFFYLYLWCDSADAAADDTYSSLQPVRQELPLGYDSLQLVATVPTDTYQPLVPPRDTRGTYII